MARPDDPLSDAASAPTTTAAPDDYSADAPLGWDEARPLLSGQAIVAIIVGVGICLAAAAWLWHYETRRVPQTFWGFESPRIFREAKEVRALLIRPEDATAAAPVPYYDNLFLVDDARYMVVEQVDVSADAGLPRVRELLNDYSNYGNSEVMFSNPNWRFALEFHFQSEDPHNPGDFTAMIVFDEEVKLGRPQTVEKIIQTDRMAAEMTGFFERVLPQAKELKNMPSSLFARPLGEGGTPSPPSATPTATGPSTTAADVDVVTTPSPSPMPSSTAPRVQGPALPDFSQPLPRVPPPTTAGPAATPSGTPPPAAVVPDRGGPGIGAPPVTVGPAQVPTIPGLPLGPGTGGGLPLPPVNPGAPLFPSLNPPGGPTAPLVPGLPPSGIGGANNLTPPPTITLPPLQVVPNSPK